jgi:hypothetical protein
MTTGGGYRDSMATAMAASPRDWSLAKDTAWLYGIVCGWDEPALKEVAKRHGWDRVTVARLRDLRAEWVSS